MTAPLMTHDTEALRGQDEAAVQTVKAAILRDVLTIRFDEASVLTDHMHPHEVDILVERAARAALAALAQGGHHEA